MSKNNRILEQDTANKLRKYLKPLLCALMLPLLFAGKIYAQVDVLHAANFNTGADGYTPSTYSGAKDWVRGTSVTVDGMAISSGGSNFYYLVSDGGTGTAGDSYLTSSAFSTVGYSNIYVSFRDFFYQASPSANSRIYLEYSINGGAYTSIDVTKTDGGSVLTIKQGKLGAHNDFRISNIAIPVQEQSSVVIRLRYNHSNDWVWAIDDVKVTGVVTSAWNAKPTAYCTPSFSTNESVNRVIFNDFDNISNWKGKQYETGTSSYNTGTSFENFTHVSTMVTMGNTYTLTVYGHTAGNYTCYIYAYFDWNRDGDFNDSGEAYDMGSFANNDNGSVSATITIPSTFTEGITRMRIMKRYRTKPTNPCSIDGDGQAEDYTIYVKPNCTAPTVYTVSGSGSYCAGGSGVTITLSGSQTGANYQLFKDNVAYGAAFAGTGSSISATFTDAGTYTVKTLAGTYCAANMSGSATITVNPTPTPPALQSITNP